MPGYQRGGPDPYDIGSPLTAFGDMAASEITPVEQIMYVYGIGDKTETISSTGGSVTVSNSMVNCNTGTSVGGYGVARSKRALIYRPGQGGEIRFTAVFNTPVALSLQFAGLFSATDALTFGYNGTSFGVLHRYGGALEIQKVQITAAASGAETVTLLLDGTTFTIPVTSGTVQHNAYEIGEYVEANTTAWKVDIVNDTVYFLAQSVGDKTGTFSIASTGTLAGTFTEVQAGATNTEDWTYQDDWNRDTVSWLDPTKGIPYKIEFQYLGFGPVKFYVGSPEIGKFINVHTLEYANKNTTPSLQNPSLKGGWAAASLGSTTALTLSGASLCLINQGIRIKREESHAYVNTKNVSTTFINIFTIKNRLIFGSIPNLAEITPILVTGASESSKTTIIEVIKNATIDGEPNFQYIDEDNQVALVDTAGTTYTAGDGKLVATTTVSPSGASPALKLNELKIDLLPGDTLSFVARITGGNASDVTVSFNWDEDL